MSKPNQKVLKKIEKLLAKGQSENATEAQLFTAKAMALMAEHKISMEEVELAAYNDANPIAGERVEGFKTPNHRRIDTFAIELGEAIARSMGVDVTFVRGTSTLKFWGRTEQRKVAVYLFVFIYNMAVDERDKTYNRLYQRWHYQKRKGNVDPLAPNPMKGWKASWNEGFVRELRARVREEFKKPFEHAEREFALVVQDDLKAVKEYFKKHLPNLNYSDINGRYGGNDSGLISGMKAAREAPLRRGVDEGKRSKQKQLTG